MSGLEVSYSTVYLTPKEFNRLELHYEEIKQLIGACPYPLATHMRINPATVKRTMGNSPIVAYTISTDYQYPRYEFLY